ncbi:TRP5 (YGL026C) [Zygosaccharomyces parabailii]|uniref:Tryptophan synthase n=1 Tax=Zygosaccharomyces bailii (strain CLIB 213 / ATCC 58445 / CBS 680 / BCRC 21525 / NBRC 1098 / NCYC 1416 / NRRL Y-2227) TaxID=1333698 RepID=A0A8J2WUS0_ZYGB2|nr:TRP5 (YGL026C) [Zygosaccharomyces parabailii]CDF87552.1 BN860_09010g1_1 [Zygosaccharomyces bailii CLIB 213]CDH15394.1 Tryptophan synthase [Zygosaccharomyces bailii ISA1307]SJM87757.1 Tryptophan synthase [Zygosaccharomyces bailii]
MSELLRQTFANAKQEGRKALVTFMTAGFPTIEDTIPILKGFQDGGVDVIELGMPFSDPIADGPTIQVSNTVALRNGVTLQKTLELVARAREEGITVPILLMGYYNPILTYGEEKFIKDAAEAGANGFIIVDLPPEEALKVRNYVRDNGLSLIPLVAPSTTNERLELLSQIADSFVYVVSRMGTTGVQASVASDLGQLVARVKNYTKDTPVAVGFGVSTRQHYLDVGAHSDGVVIGSKIITLVGESPEGKRYEAAKEYVSGILDGKKHKILNKEQFKEIQKESVEIARQQKELVNNFTEAHKFPTRFGDFGGQYVPEALHACLRELEKGFDEAVADPKFWEDFRALYPYIGRPSSLHKAERLSERMGGAQIWLKREDLNHTGSHKINNALAQVLLARRLGKTEIIAETGAGQHGVATATACAKFGLGCTVFMGAEDVRRQALNVFRMRILGAKVVAVTNGTKTLRDATSEAFRFWVTNLKTTYYVVGSAIGPHPYPTLVRTFQSVIGQETKEQFAALNNGKLPDAVVACVGGGSNSSGMFSPFEKDLSVQLLGVEAGGDGVDTAFHSATLTAGRPGVFHGVRTFVLQDKDGQVHDTHSVSAGLDYPGVGPELAFWKASGRANFVAATDAQALEGFRLLSQLEGIIPALESSHAVFGACELAKTMRPDQHIVINVSGRGDKDVQSVAEVLPKLGPKINWDLRFEEDPSSG